MGSSPTTGTTSEQALYRLLRLFSKSQSALMPLLLLSKSQPLTLGCDLVSGANLKTAASILLRYSKNPERDRVRDFYLFKGSLFVHHGEGSNRLTHCVPPVAQLPGERFFMASEVFLLRSFTRKAVESFMKPFRNKISPLEANDYRLPFSALLTEIRLFGEMKAPGIVSRAGDLIPAIRTKFCH